ncbi:protein of unknown function [Streptomyces murinus]
MSATPLPSGRMSAAVGTTAVPNLIARYAELVDSGDFAGVGELFAAAVFIGSGEPAEGAAAVEHAPGHRDPLRGRHAPDAPCRVEPRRRGRRGVGDRHRAFLRHGVPGPARTAFAGHRGGAVRGPFRT